ncbi:MAG: lipoyl synthase [Bdellovibrionales bacterium]|nr:lipoyl synthase [Bdellovibrionales bacterium]
MALTSKPEWIRMKLPSGPSYLKISSLLRERSLNTVCEEAKCPNLAECWGSGTATIMLMGDMCTRGCRFCAVKSGIPSKALDPLEPQKTAETVALMNLKYVVLTSVNRDDLMDGGASHIAETIGAIRERTPNVLIEVLIPDFQGNENALKMILEASPDVIAHNIETTRRLTPAVRDGRASYDQSLQVLEYFKRYSPTQYTKTSIMLGLSETRDEIVESFRDLRTAQVDFLTLGQYLQPTKKHLSVVSFVHPDEFKHLEQEALSHGFLYVASGPLVRSSYKAGEYFISSLIRSRGKTDLFNGVQLKGVQNGI